MGRTATVSKAVGEGRLPKALPAFSSAQLKKAAQAAFQAVEKVACATFSRFSYLPCAYGAARELCRETLATQGFLRI